MEGEGRPERDRTGGEGYRGGAGHVFKAGWRCTGDQILLRAKPWRRNRGWKIGRGTDQRDTGIFLCVCQEGSTGNLKELFKHSKGKT